MIIIIINLMILSGSRSSLVNIMFSGIHSARRQKGRAARTIYDVGLLLVTW